MCIYVYTCLHIFMFLHEKFFRDIPPLFKSAPAKGTYQFAYENNKALVSYRSKNDETILLLFSLHPDDKINKMENKSEIVHYNKTEGASDVFDKVCVEYTINRMIFRWAIRIFHGMLDQTAVNNFVLYTLNAANQVMTRDTFLLQLSMNLIKSFFINRVATYQVNF